MTIADWAPRHVRPYVEAVIAAIQADPRVVGLTAGGSAATGTMDEFSDLDLVVVCRDEASARTAPRSPAFAAGLGPLMDRGSVLGLDPLRGHQARARRAIRMPRRARRPPGDRVRTPHRADGGHRAAGGTAPRADGARSGTGAGSHGGDHTATLSLAAPAAARSAARPVRTGVAMIRRGV